VTGGVQLHFLDLVAVDDAWLLEPLCAILGGT
jgi:hypothetical protein